MSFLQYFFLTLLSLTILLLSLADRHTQAWAAVSDDTVAKVEGAKIALARAAAHPNAAKLYIDFILSKEGQEIITKEFIGISDRPDVKRVFTREGLKLHYADLSLAERYDEITKKFDAVFKIR
jgi:ABC-type Fe3+ transport system substrate-binding protein